MVGAPHRLVHFPRYNPNPRKIMNLAKFEQRYIPEPFSGCWLWTGNASKYGHFQANGVQTLAHRVSWMIHHGGIPKGMFVCHKCDTPLCVNPAHLFLGTQKDNMGDAKVKGRYEFGEQRWNSKLTKQQVLEIRQDYRSSHIIASEYGISASHVRNIKHNRLWRSI
jgi:hypothetical protein